MEYRGSKTNFFVGVILLWNIARNFKFMEPFYSVAQLNNAKSLQKKLTFNSKPTSLRRCLLSRSGFDHLHKTYIIQSSNVYLKQKIYIDVLGHKYLICIFIYKYINRPRTTF